MAVDEEDLRFTWAFAVDRLEACPVVACPEEACLEMACPEVPCSAAASPVVVSVEVESGLEGPGHQMPLGAFVPGACHLAYLACLASFEEASVVGLEAAFACSTVE